MARIKQWLYGRVDADGRLFFDDELAFSLVRSDLRGKEVQVLIEPKANRRSRMENNYYWGVVVKLIAKWMGDTAEAAHEALRWRFLRRTNKRGMWTVQSTAELTTKEFEEYLSRVRQWASEQEVFIPLPNEPIY